MAGAQRSLPGHGLLALLALLAFTGVLALQPPQAQAALPFPEAKSPPARVVPPVQPPLAADPSGRVRGTMILVHGGGWAGHDGYAQSELMKKPGDLFLARGWRVVSIDYHEGRAGLQDVLETAGAELARARVTGRCASTANPRVPISR